jgi:hypothetical protein
MLLRALDFFEPGFQSVLRIFKDGPSTSFHRVIDDEVGICRSKIFGTAVVIIAVIHSGAFRTVSISVVGGGCVVLYVFLLSVVFGRLLASVGGSCLRTPVAIEECVFFISTGSAVGRLRDVRFQALEASRNIRPLAVTAGKRHRGHDKRCG